MIAMELNGAHVKRTVRLTWLAGKSRSKVMITKKITKVTHWPNGDVSVSQGRYYDPDRYPFDAVVEFLD